MEAGSSNEKFNSAWKKKLEDAAGLQETALQNKDAAWEKLQARLAEKPRDKKIVWYWLAAASILAAIMISLTTINKTTTGIAQHTHTPSVKESAAQKEHTIKNVTPGITSTQTKKQSQKNITAGNDERKSTITDTSNAIQHAINDQQNLQTQTFTVPAVADTAAIAIIASIPVQKKLKVVHVNELGEPVEFPPDVAHSSDLHLFQLKLAQQEIYNASSMASNNNSALSFKPKNSSN